MHYEEKSGVRERQRGAEEAETKCACGFSYNSLTSLKTRSSVRYVNHREKLQLPTLSEFYSLIEFLMCDEPSGLSAVAWQLPRFPLTTHPLSFHLYLFERYQTKSARITTNQATKQTDKRERIFNICCHQNIMKSMFLQVFSSMIRRASGTDITHMCPVHVVAPQQKLQ